MNAEDVFSAWSGEDYSCSNRAQMVFRKVDTLCASRGWDVEDYVKFAIHFVRKTHFRVLVADLALKSVERRYTSVIAEPEMTEDAWNGCESLLVSLIRSGISESEALMSPMYVFPAWFRCLYPEDCEREIVLWGIEAYAFISRDASAEELAERKAPENWRRLKDEYEDKST